MDEWLQSLGLEQYAPAFRAAGYDDLHLLTVLNETDLNNIEQASGRAILPGHSKKLLLMAQKLQLTRPPKRRRSSSDPVAPESARQPHLQVPTVSQPPITAPPEVPIQASAAANDGRNISVETV